MSLFDELKRRNVFRVGIAYIIVAWLIAQVADLVFDNITAPDWLMPALLFMLAAGFFLALFFAWAFEMTPEGLKKEKEVDRSKSITPKTGRKLDHIIIALLAVGLVYFAWESRFKKGSELISPSTEQVLVENEGEKLTLTPATEKGSDPISDPILKAVDNKSVAVLPFVNMSSDPEQEYFSDGISEEILNALAKVKELKVAGRTSSFSFKGKNEDLRTIGKKLNVNLLGSLL